MTKKLQIDPGRAGYTNPEFPGKFTTEPVGHFAKLQIDNRDGKAAYDFECVAYRIVGENVPQIAGDGLTCGLFVPNEKTNLLLYSVDTYSRMTPAIILPKQLQGAAARNPVLGITRHFRLRGLSLTLTFGNSRFGKDDFGKTTLIRSELTIDITPDPSAQTPVGAD